MPSKPVTSLSTNQIVALSRQCARCTALLGSGHVVVATYVRHTLERFSNSLDIGLMGQGVRNIWAHVDCQKPLLKDWNMHPDLHTCLRCKKKIAAHDMIQPVFQVLDSAAINPIDPTDVGITLNDRVYFSHCECHNPTLSKGNGIIVGL